MYKYIFLGHARIWYLSLTVRQTHLSGTYVYQRISCLSELTRITTQILYPRHHPNWLTRSLISIIRCPPSNSHMHIHESLQCDVDHMLGTYLWSRHVILMHWESFSVLESADRMIHDIPFKYILSDNNYDSTIRVSSARTVRDFWEPRQQHAAKQVTLASLICSTYVYCSELYRPYWPIVGRILLILIFIFV